VFEFNHLAYNSLEIFCVNLLYVDNGGTEMVQVTVEENLQRLLPNPDALVATSKGMQTVKFCCQQNPPVGNWGCPV